MSEPAVAEEPVLWLGAEVICRVRCHVGRGPLVVTFTPRTAFHPAPEGFAESFLLRHGLDAIHFLARRNHWWQTGEIEACLRWLRAEGHLPPGRRVVLYGSSMGAAGAILYSGAFGADAVIGLSPVVTTYPPDTAFDARYRADARAITYLYPDPLTHVAPGAELVLFYDPFEPLDAGQVGLLLRRVPAMPVPLAFCGHGAPRYLRELGLLSGTVLDLIHGRFAPGRFRQALRERRRNAPTYWFGLARELHRRGRRRGVLLHALSTLSDLLGRAEGREARRHLGRMTAPLIAMLEDLGRDAEAWDLARRAVATRPRSPAAWNAVRDLARRRGHIVEAVLWTLMARRVRPEGDEFGSADLGPLYDEAVRRGVGGDVLTRFARPKVAERYADEIGAMIRSSHHPGHEPAYARLVDRFAA